MSDDACRPSSRCRLAPALWALAGLVAPFLNPTLQSSFKQVGQTETFLAEDSCGRYTTADLIRELEAGRPAYVGVIRNDQNMADPVDSLTHFRQDARLREHVSREYREVGWLEDFLLFRRKDL
ncbi:MAG: hypothetical protein IMZ44_25565 [Planctomycetes bacterium]|nr:hypothetical protein [Planctomycetota bacterium]